VEKIGREANDPRKAKTDALLWDVLEVLDRYKNLRLLKPGPRLAVEIDRRADAVLAEARRSGKKGRVRK